MIQFNDRKDNHELELSDLETFINFQYKKKTTVENNNGNETSSEDDLTHMFRKQNRLPSIKQVKKRKKIVKGSSAHAMDRKVMLSSVSELPTLMLDTVNGLSTLMFSTVTGLLTLMCLVQ